MRQLRTLAALSAVTLLAATTAWAGGAACSAKSEASAAAKGCTVSGAKLTSAKGAGGSHCSGIDKNNAEAMAKACSVGKSQAIYSFAVPSAECDGCVNGIQSALMAQDGIHCAHVDLEARVAYVIADKKLNTKTVSNVIQKAGFKNSYRGEGKKVQAEFAKAMSASAGKSGMACCAKEKDRV
jgi:copper chaperone CopZ